MPSPQSSDQNAALLVLVFDSANNQVSLPQHIDSNGFKVREVAHNADMLRLRLMRDVGGVYMDADVVTVKSFEPLLKVVRAWLDVFGCLKPVTPAQVSFAMGQEGERGEYGLCNAVLVSKPHSRFAVRWIALFDEVFDARIWSMHSVKYPLFASALWPSDITVRGDSPRRFVAFPWI